MFKNVEFSWNIVQGFALGALREMTGTTATTYTIFLGPLRLTITTR